MKVVKDQPIETNDAAPIDAAELKKMLIDNYFRFRHFRTHDEGYKAKALTTQLLNQFFPGVVAAIVKEEAEAKKMSREVNTNCCS